MSLLGGLVATFAVLSLLSIGGVGAMIPEIHRQVVDLHRWMDDPTFAALVALAQAAPGPNLLIVSLIGWSLAGVAGLLATTLAMMIPSSLLAIGVGRLLARDGLRERIAPLRRSLAPIALGLMLASSVVMARAAFQGPASLAITAVVGMLATTTRLSPLWSLAGAAVLAVTLHRLNLAF